MCVASINKNQTIYLMLTNYVSYYITKFTN